MSGDYGFTLNIDGNALAQLKQVEAAVKSLQGSVRSATSEISEGFNALGESARDLRNHLIEAFSVYEIYNFGKELLHLTAEFQGFENVIRGSAMGIVDGQRDLDYLRDTIERLHLPMKEAYEGFSEMEAGFYGTTIQGERLRKVFTGLSEISLVKHIQPAQFSRAIYAMKEIGELGTLQQRQLKMLSFDVYGAGAMAAEAMKMTPAQLHEAMRKGQIKADDFLPKLAKVMSEVAAPFLQNASDSLISQINDEQNSVIQTMRNMGDSLMPLWSDILKKTITAMHEIQVVWKAISGNGDFVNFLKEIFDLAVKIVPAFVAWRMTMTATNTVIASFIAFNEGLAGSTVEVTTAMEGATAATAGFDTALIASGFGALAGAVAFAVSELLSFNDEFDKTVDKIGNFAKNTGSAESIINTSRDVFAAFNNKNLNTSQKGINYNDLIQLSKQATDALALNIIPDIDSYKAKIGNTQTDLDKIHAQFKKEGLLMPSEKSGILQDRVLSDEHLINESSVMSNLNCRI